MSALKLFISHSSRLDDCEQDQQDPDHNWALLRDTCEKLKEKYADQIEVLVDQDPNLLHPGSDWDRNINLWLTECHVAVILFSQPALKQSMWVQKEACILSHRKSLHPDFTIIPLFIEGQSSPEDLTQDIWSILHIDANQAPTIRTAADIVDAVATNLQAAGGIESYCIHTPYDRLVHSISKLLAEGTDELNLEQVLESLDGIEKISKTRDLTYDAKMRFSKQLARYLIRTPEESLENFSTILNRLTPKPYEERAYELLRAIRSLWVDASAAGGIRYTEKGSGIFAINGWMITEDDDTSPLTDEDPHPRGFTIQRYLERAWPADYHSKLAIVTSRSDVDDILQEMRNSFVKGKALSDERKNKRLKKIKHPMVVLIDCSEDGLGRETHQLMDEIIQPIKADFPNVTFALYTGAQLPDALDDRVIRLTPPIENDELEEDQYCAEMAARDVLHNRYG
ncbi:MAG: toll/interleukin-1 receptor domain-containing protein [Candidatus Sedimenticola sp. (ex Thyasira tokunagai)]